MTEHDKTRRTFVRAVLSVGAAAGSGLVPDAGVQAQEQRPDAASSSHTVPRGREQHAFFNSADARTMEMLTERLMPGAPGKPGARDAGVLNYIDLALAGAYADLQDFYRRGLASLDAHCQASFKAPFHKLTAAQQDQVITALEQGKAEQFGWPS